METEPASRAIGDENNEVSVGLIGMRERVVQLGGTFSLLGRPGLGVRIRIEIPFEETIYNGKTN